MTEAGYALASFALLPDIEADANGVILTICNRMRFVNMRCNSGDSKALQAIANVLGEPVPLEPNTVAREKHTIYWLGPDEWLIAIDAESQKPVDDLRTATKDLYATFTDISDGMVCMKLTGDDAGEVLAKGCTLDLDADRFVVGDCAQTTLAKAPMLVSKTADGFEIIVRRSFAEYAALWLRHAATEFGIRIVAT